MLTEVKYGKRIQGKAIDFTMEECCACGIPFFMPTSFRDMKVEHPGTSFYCPNGHGQHFTGKTEAEKLREQLEQLQKEKEQQHEDLQNKWLDAIGEKQKIEKKLKRVHNGVCPCCNRSFANLRKHIAAKHPELIKENKLK